MKDARAELVRIDEKGVAHPIGSTASARMRTRAGAFRLLPAPEHVVFMRYTGEDGRRDDEDGAIVRLSGEVTAPGAMCDVFALLGQTGWRGELAVLQGEEIRSIFFEQGNIAGVQTNVDEERIGRVLYKFGVIDDAQLEQIIEKKNAERRRFGECAVELGVLKQDEVFNYLGRQVEEVVHSTLMIGDGTFFFLDGFDDARLVARHVVSANALLMDAVTRMDEMRYFQEKIPSSDYIPYRLPGTGDPADEFAKTLNAVDGRRSVEEIGRATGRGEFDTSKDLYALIQSKHVAMHPPRVSGGLPAVVAMANEALRTAHQVADELGHGEALRQNLQSYSAGAGVYDMLFRNAGPNDRGVLTADVVAENVSLVAHGQDPEQILRQMLYDYVGFAIFSIGQLAGSDKEVELSQRLSAMVAGFQPQA